MKRLKITICLLVALMITAGAQADTFGTGDNQFTIDFVTITHPGNAPDTGGTGNGAVAYEYRIGRFEITNAQWDKFVLDVGLPTGNPPSAYDQTSLFTGPQNPVNMVSWYEVAQFCNYLTSGDKSKGVYQFSGDNTNPGDFIGIDRNAAKAAYQNIYFIPTEDEWYKAAYLKPDGITYSIYSSGFNEPPARDEGWNVYGGVYSGVWDVGTGFCEQNGTYDMMGNVCEWTESTYVYNGTLYYVFRGGFYGNDSVLFRSDSRQCYHRYYDDYSMGLRVASLPLTSCPFFIEGDLNNDCKVDMTDLKILASNWLNDYFGYDYAILARNWFINCNTDPSNPACTTPEE